MTPLDTIDIKAIFLAKHAQHVVLIHFPIALFTTGVAFDVMARWTRRSGFADAAYFNFLIAAIATMPVLATGILAWQFQLEGQKLKGILLFHLILGCASSIMVWLVWWAHFRGRKRQELLPRYWLLLELTAVFFISLTAHLGGFLSGVNAPG